jgi:hypothetical protein
MSSLVLIDELRDEFDLYEEHDELNDELIDLNTLFKLSHESNGAKRALNAMH